MPRRGKGRRRHGRRGGGNGLSMNNIGAMTVRVPFRVCFNLNSEAAGFNTSNLNLEPSNLGGIASHVATSFELFRVTELKLRFVPGVLAVNSESYQFGVAYSALATGDESSGPAGMSNMAQFQCFALSGGTPVSLRIPRNILLAVSNKWYRCSTTGTSTYDEYIQGSMWLASLYGTAATNENIHVCLAEGVIEFRSPLDQSDVVPVVVEEVKKNDLNPP